MNKENLRALVKTYYDFQDMRVRMANRLKKKKDGSDQVVIDEINLDTEAIPVLVDMWQDLCENEKRLLKEIENELESFPVYTQFLKIVKGCGPTMSAVIISEYDIRRADTVSKLWQYTGLNPGMVRGKVVKGSKKDGTHKLVETDTMIRGDKKTSGFIAPFNSWLRSKMIGVLAASFLRSNSPYRKYYDDYKNRLENEDRPVNGDPNNKKWCEVSKGRRDLAAKRYMIKMFLKDLYQAWRTLEGLPVRVPYAEEYLGRKHSA